MKDDDRMACKCEKCNSYPECALDSNLLVFCMEGKAPCPVDARGCPCPGCPVREKYGFQGDYFCVRGKAKAVGR